MLKIDFLLSSSAKSTLQTSRILRVESPSQKGGISPFLCLPALMFSILSFTMATSNGTSSLVPIVIVDGRSVLGRNVKQGILRNVDSSEFHHCR